MGCGSSRAATEVIQEGGSLPVVTANNRPPGHRVTSQPKMESTERTSKNLIQHATASKNGFEAKPYKSSHKPPDVIISDSDANHDITNYGEDGLNTSDREAFKHFSDKPTYTDVLESEKEVSVSTPKTEATATPRPAAVIPKMTTESEVQQQLTAFKMQQEINADKLNQQQMRSKLRLEEKLKQRRQKKLGNDSGVVVIEPEVTTPADVKAGMDMFVDRKIDEAPQPVAPTTSKDVLYSDDNIALFTDLEKYAVSLESSHVTFETLMSNLFISDLSDLEKVRILFHWITAQNLNAIQFPPTMPEDSPMAYLKAVKDDTKSYASLFQRLCHAAGLHAKLVQGFLKGVGYTPDYKFSGSTDPLRGTWNAVLIDGQWRLIDTHWGARHVNEESGMARETWQTEYRYEEHYFLTDPDKLINTHFPDDREWQLLPDPINLEQFQEMIKQWPLFYKLKLCQTSHQRGMIITDQHGYVKITLGVSPLARSDAKFKGELRHRENVRDSSDLQQYVLHYSTESEETFEIFLPKAGQFLFKIFGLSSKFSDDELFTNVCLYQIDCPKITSPPHSSYLPPFPVVNFCYGPSKMMRDLGMEARSHLGPAVECDHNGEARIVVAVPRSQTNLTFTQEMTRNQSSVPNSALHCLLPDRNDPNWNLLTVHILTPTEGTYSVTLFAGNKSDTSQGLAAFCHYLVTSKNRSTKIGNQFPPVPNGALGKMESDFSNLGLDIVSCSGGDDEACWLKSDANGETYFSFRHKQPLVIIANLVSSTQGYDDFAAVFTDGEFSTVLVRYPPEVAQDDILLLKLYAAPVTQAKGLPCVFTAFVGAPASTVVSQALPQAPNRIWGPFGEKSYACGIKVPVFSNSTPAIATSSSADSFPFRRYQGGGDFEVKLRHSGPIHLKPRLAKANAGGTAEREGFALVTESGTEHSTILARFTDTGLFALSLYGESHGNNARQLVPLYNVLIQVDAASKSTAPFPNALNIWTMSWCRLQGPLSRDIKRKVPTNVKLSLGRYERSGTDSYKPVPYHKVLLLIDDSTPQDAVSTGSCEYEWSYIAGPSEKKVGVIVQSDENNQSMNYALQFAIVD